MNLILKPVRVVFFDKDDDPYIPMLLPWKARLDEDACRIVFESETLSASYDLRSDTGAIWIQNEYEETDHAATVSRLLTTAIGGAALKKDGAFGAVMLDLSSRGVATNSRVNGFIAFHDLSIVMFDCIEDDLTELAALCPTNAKGDDGTEWLTNRSSLINRLIEDGPRALEELRTNREELYQSMDKFSATIESGETFKERDSARRLLKIAKDKILDADQVIRSVRFVALEKEHEAAIEKSSTKNDASRSSETRTTPRPDSEKITKFLSSQWGWATGAAILFLILYQPFGEERSALWRRVFQTGIKYETPISLQGKLISATAPSSITYDGKPHQFPALELRTPISVICDKKEPECEPRMNVGLIQLLLNDEQVLRFEQDKGFKANIHGTLFQSHTGHHFTPVLLNVESIRRSTAN